jgi:hypothetical protein
MNSIVTFVTRHDLPLNANDRHGCPCRSLSLGGIGGDYRERVPFTRITNGLFDALLMNRASADHVSPTVPAPGVKLTTG